MMKDLQEKLQHYEIIPELLKKYMESPNIAEFLDSQQLQKIGDNCHDGMKDDQDSRKDWLEVMKESMKIARQSLDKKTTPWPGASNVRFPLITTACIQFNARTNPVIVQGDKVVRMDVMRPDPNDEESERVTRLARHMSYQLIGQSDHWRYDTDRLTMILPMIGTCYRKSFFNPMLRQPDTEFCLPEDVIINNNVRSLNSAQRITHVIYLSTNEIVERMKAGVFSQIDLKDFNEQNTTTTDASNRSQKQPNIYSTDDDIAKLDDVLHKFGEQHRYLDLDGDGYQEPYIVTFHVDTKKVCRIVARYDVDSFIFDAKQTMIKIVPVQYFTDYHFIPSFDGTYHSLGFGILLYPLNETANSLINQLIDAGVLSNRQSGFLGQGLRLPKTEMYFKPGEWKTIPTADGADISRNIVPLPVREPSMVLFQMLNMIISTGKELASVSDVMQGVSPGSNVPATTVMALIQQGQQVFSSIAYRLYNSLKTEFNKLYEINRKYGALEETFRDSIGTATIKLGDYVSSNYGVFPVADPKMDSTVLKLAKAQALYQTIGAPGVNQYEIMKEYYTALEIENIDLILPKPQENAPPPLAVQQADLEMRSTKIENAMKIVDRRHKAKELDLKEKELQITAASYGTKATTDKYNTIANLAKIEQMPGGRLAVEEAKEDVQTDYKKTEVKNVVENANIAKNIHDIGEDLKEILSSKQEGSESMEGMTSGAVQGAETPPPVV